MTGDLAARLTLGLNGDPDQRAATTLLAEAAHGVWLTKLAGWDQYVVPVDDPRRPGALWIDWQQLREDLTTDHTAREAYATWADSPEGRRATAEDHDTRWDQMVPARPWHGASTGELVLLDITPTIAPGGLLADGLPRLDSRNRSAVIHAIQTLADALEHPACWETPPARRLPSIGRSLGDRMTEKWGARSRTARHGRRGIGLDIMGTKWYH